MIGYSAGPNQPVPFPYTFGSRQLHNKLRLLHIGVSDCPRKTQSILISISIFLKPPKNQPQRLSSFIFLRLDEQIKLHTTLTHSDQTSNNPPQAFLFLFNGFPHYLKPLSPCFTSHSNSYNPIFFNLLSSLKINTIPILWTQSLLFFQCANPIFHFI